MRTQECREAMEKVSDLCDIKPAVIKKTDPVIQLCKVKGNEPLKHCATAALLPLLEINDPKIKNAVIAEMNQILRQRDKKGKFIKDRLTQREVEGIIEKYQPSVKNEKRENQPRYRLTKQHQNTIKRLISLQYASDEREAFNLVFKWATERIANQK